MNAWMTTDVDERRAAGSEPTGLWRATRHICQPLVVVVAFLGILVLTSCGNDGPDERDDAPTDQATIMLGERVYQSNCATCHGNEGEGEPNWQSPREDGSYPAPPHDSSGHTWHHSDEVLLDIIRRGGQAAYGREGFRSRMPAWADELSDEEIWAVLAYIKTLWGPEERGFQAGVSED